MSPTIRRILSNEGPSLQAFRLGALAEAPMAFGSTLAREQAFTNDIWRERAAHGASGADRVIFVAEQDGRCLRVTASNDPAVALYEKCGFSRTGESKPLAHSPSLTLFRMERDLV
jgi:hypothetical protein